MLKRFAPALLLAAALAAPAQAQDVGPSMPPGGNASILSWTPEQQLYGYRHMERWTAVHVIKGGARVKSLRKGRPIAPSWSFEGKPQTVDGFMQAMNTSAILVLKDGKVVLEKYGLGRTADERWTSFSVAKSVTSTLVGAAIRDGHIKSLDDNVATYISELKGSAYDGVSVRQLLTMTSGVKWNEDYTDPKADVARAGFEPGEPGINRLISYMRKLPREAAPGTKWVYKTGETDLAGFLVSRATGKSLADYASEKIWAPYGMEADAVWVDDLDGHERGGCCMSMTARDYARLGQFMLDGGNGALPKGWVADATRSHHAFPPGGNETGYGYFWWIIPGGYAAEGIFGQQIYIYPAEKVVVAVNSAWPVATAKARWAAQNAMAEAMRKAAR